MNDSDRPHFDAELDRVIAMTSNGRETWNPEVREGFWSVYRWMPLDQWISLCRRVVRSCSKRFPTVADFESARSARADARAHARRLDPSDVADRPMACSLCWDIGIYQLEDGSKWACSCVQGRNWRGRHHDSTAESAAEAFRQREVRLCLIREVLRSGEVPEILDPVERSRLALMLCQHRVNLEDAPPNG